jgi:hypothetical protein
MKKVFSIRTKLERVIIIWIAKYSTEMAASDREGGGGESLLCVMCVIQVRCRVKQKGSVYCIVLFMRGNG